MDHQTTHNDFTQELLIDFIYAGCTALALAISFIYAGSWPFYLISLLPFLYRISKVDTAGSAVSGGFFAVSLLFIIFPSDILSRPAVFYFIILSFSAAVVIFSIIINRCKRHFWLALILSASFYFPLEYFLKTCIDSGPAFSHHINTFGFNLRVATLLFFLLISLLIVAVNSLLLILIDVLGELPCAGRYYIYLKRPFFVYKTIILVLLKHWKCLPSLRAPPL